MTDGIPDKVTGEPHEIFVFPEMGVTVHHNGILNIVHVEIDEDKLLNNIEYSELRTSPSREDVASAAPTSIVTAYMHGRLPLPQELWDVLNSRANGICAGRLTYGLHSEPDLRECSTGTLRVSYQGIRKTDIKKRCERLTAKILELEETMAEPCRRHIQTSFLGRIRAAVAGLHQEERDQVRQTVVLTSSWKYDQTPALDEAQAMEGALEKEIEELQARLAQARATKHEAQVCQILGYLADPEKIGYLPDPFKTFLVAEVAQLKPPAASPFVF